MQKINEKGEMQVVCFSNKKKLCPPIREGIQFGEKDFHIMLQGRI
jgi:hypothetical protein